MDKKTSPKCTRFGHLKLTLFKSTPPIEDTLSTFDHPKTFSVMLCQLLVYSQNKQILTYSALCYAINFLFHGRIAMKAWIPWF